jgi:hypothetical protein
LAGPQPRSTPTVGRVSASYQQWQGSPAHGWALWCVYSTGRSHGSHGQSAARSRAAAPPLLRGRSWPHTRALASGAAEASRGQGESRWLCYAPALRAARGHSWRASAWRSWFMRQHLANCTSCRPTMSFLPSWHGVAAVPHIFRMILRSMAQHRRPRPVSPRVAGWPKERCPPSEWLFGRQPKALIAAGTALALPRPPRGSPHRLHSAARERRHSASPRTSCSARLPHTHFVTWTKSTNDGGGVMIEAPKMFRLRLDLVRTAGQARWRPVRGPLKIAAETGLCQHGAACELNPEIASGHVETRPHQPEAGEAPLGLLLHVLCNATSEAEERADVCPHAAGCIHRCRTAGLLSFCVLTAGSR